MVFLTLPFPPRQFNPRSCQIVSPRKSSLDLSLSYTYNISPFACFIFLPTLAIWHCTYLSVSFLHYKVASLGPQLSSWPLFNPGPVMVPGTCCFNAHLLNQLIYWTVNKPIDFTRSVCSGCGPGPGDRLHWLSRWNSCYRWGLGCAIHPLELISLRKSNSPVSAWCCVHEISYHGKKSLENCQALWKLNSQ